MTAENIMQLNINERALGYARIYSSLLKDEYQRKRAYASLVALYALVDALEKTDNSVQKSMTLFRNPVLNEQYEISDIYVNNWHIDVRVITDGDAVLVPKSHYDNGLLPDFYAVVKVDKTLQTAELLGFADPEKTEKQAYDYHYCTIALLLLISYDEFLVKVRNPKQVEFKPQEHEEFKELYLGLMDEEMRPEIKNKLLKHLFDCVQCRTEFCCFTGFEMVNCNMGSYPDIFEDLTLGIIGAQDVDKAKYAGKEETIYVGNDEEQPAQDVHEENEQTNSQENSTSEDTVQEDFSETQIDDEEKEMTVSDILDELFGEEEGYIEPETADEKTNDAIENLENYEIDDAFNEQKEEVETKSEIEEDEPLDEYTESPINEEPSFENNNTIVEETNSEPIVDVETEKILDINEDMQLIEDDSVGSLSDDEELPFEVVDEVKEENASDDLEILEKDEELQIIDDDEPLNSIEIDEPVMNVPPSLEEDSALEIHDYDDESEMLKESEDDINTAPTKPHEEVQKVIVDYDEAGEPIYSYITNVTQETEMITDDESFEEYPQEDDGISDGEDSEFEEWNDEDIDVDKAEKELDEEMAEFEEYSENDSEEQNGGFEEYKEDSADSEEEFEEYKEDSAPAQNIDIHSDEETLDDESEEAEDENTEDNDESSEEYDSDEDYEEDDEEEPVKKKGSPLLPLLVLLLIVAGGAGAFFFLKNKNQEDVAPVVPEKTVKNLEIPAPTAVNEAEQVTDMFGSPENSVGLEVPPVNNSSQQNDAAVLPTPPANVGVVPDLTEKDLLKTQRKDINSSIANAFTNGGNRATLRSVNWLCSPQLFADSVFKAFMQDLDNVLKLNLRKNILDVTDVPKNNTVTVKIAIDKNGNLSKTLVSESSGSQQIDNIVLQSINETFEGEKSQNLNNSALKQDMYYLKVVVKL